MADFYEKFDMIHRAAFHYGINAVPLCNDPTRPFQDPKHQRRFIAACHRGYALAQRTIVEVLLENASDLAINEQERKRRELLLRKVIDGILFAMVGMQTWITRRVVLHNEPPALDFRVIETAMKTVDRLNEESRGSFAVLADLSTFVHVCDVVRVFPLEKIKLHFLELKEGRVNEILNEQLEGFAPVPESLAKIKNDPTIQPSHQRQALRMMRQRIRLNQTLELLSTDKGIDIKSNIPLHMNRDVIHEDTYKKHLVEACEIAIKDGGSAFVVNHCLHFGIACGGIKREREISAFNFAVSGLLQCVAKAPESLKQLYDELGPLLKKEKIQPHLIDLVNNNLVSVPANSLFTWNLPEPILKKIIRDEISIFCVFDLPGFMHAAKIAGLEASLSSRREGAKGYEHFGKEASPDFGGRVVKISHPKHSGETFLMAGAFARFINNLHCPLSFLRGIESHWIPANFHVDTKA